MAVYTLLQCIVVLRMLKLHKLAVRKLYLLRVCPSRCHGVLEHGLNLHRNIPLNCGSHLHHSLVLLDLC